MHRNLFTVAFLFAAAAQAQTFSVLSNFDDTHGAVPAAIHGATFVQGPDGNFYGATGGGGDFGGCGTIYQLTPTGTLTTLHSFNYTVDGCGPTSGLTLGSDGNLYGTTKFTTFKTTLGGNFTLLYTSTGNGPNLINGLIQASDGNFYGTSSSGGSGGQGTVFQMTPAGVVNILINFPSTQVGATPQGPLIQASDGNLYGTTSRGAAGGQGTVFKMSLSGAFTPVHTFCNGTNSSCPDGASPFSGLVQASDGNLYGNTQNGGTTGSGIIFKLTLGGTLSAIYNFCPNNLPCPDGYQPQGALMQASDGYLYGTTSTQGKNNLSGTLFRISTSGAFATLYQFCSQQGCADGAYPQGALVQASNGIIYGATNGGGVDTFGVIFGLQPPAAPAYSCTNTTPPTISSIDSASAYGGYSYFASGSWLEIKGTNLADLKDPRLATGSGQWASGDFNPNAPTNLDGISVSINGKPAYVWYLSPTHLNIQAPEDSTTGNVNITVTNCNATSSTTQFARRALAPGLLAPSNYTSNGTQYLIATFQSDGAYVLNTALGASFGLKSRPAKTGDVIIAYGVGFGDVTPSILPGTIVSQSNQLVNPVTFNFGTTPAQLTYSGEAGSFVGLYEFYITVPSGLPNGDVKLTVSQNGTALPQTLFLTIQN